ncbi:MarR family winged helix-turn-helix transcriptional regulator [Pseudonocardia hispaniensis]|uniref:MarR family winged helix-turn-helix transcriptional regulator n=1 Tax=Pseudonocardia hispaniensis TaxID=904933 RepID=A0ABW1J174_9PSEU
MNGEEIEIHSMPGFMIRRLHQLHDSIWESELGGVFTPPQFGVLATLAAHPGIHQQKLCSLVALDSSTGADVVNRLIRTGRVRRRRDDRDRRRYLLELTEEGRTLLAEVVPSVHEVNARLTRTLSESDRTDLLAHIDRILSQESGR